MFEINSIKRYCLFCCCEQNREMVLRGHSSSVDQLCWHPSTPYELATASSDKSVRFWDTRSGKCTHTIATSGENINLAWNKQGTEVASFFKKKNVFFNCILLCLISII